MPSDDGSRYGDQDWNPVTGLATHGSTGDPTRNRWDWEVSNSTDDEAPTTAALEIAAMPWVNSGIGRDSRIGWWAEPDRYLTPTEQIGGESGASNTNQYGPQTVNSDTVEDHTLKGGRIRFSSFRENHAGDVSHDDYLSVIANNAAIGNVNVPTNQAVAQAILLGRMNGTA